MLNKYFYSLKINNLTLLILSLIISIVFWNLIPESYKINESSDYIGYYRPVADNIVNGLPPEGLNQELGYGYPLGFPIILSVLLIISKVLFINIDTIIFIFSMSCIYVSSIILCKISQEFFTYKSSVISSLTLITYPLLLWTIKQPNSESAFLPFFLLSILFYIRALKSGKNNLLFFSGLLLGFTMLIRPIAIGLPLVFLLFCFFYKFKMKENLSKIFILLLIISSGVFTSIAPWEIYVFNRTNKIVPLGTVGGGGIYDGLTFNANLKSYRIKKNLPEDLENLMKNFSKNLNPRPAISEIAVELKTQFLNQPITVIKFYIYKFFRTLYGTDSQRNEKTIIFIQLIYFIVIAFAIKKCFKNQYMKNFDLFFIAVFLYFCFMATIALSIVRYTVPAICLLFIFLPAYVQNKELNE